MRRNNRKKFLLFIIFLFFLLLYLFNNYFINADILFGYIEVVEKEIDKDDYLLTFKNPLDNFKIETIKIDQSHTLDYVHNNKSEERNISDIWDEIVEGRNFVRLRERKFPYNIFNRFVLEELYASLGEEDRENK